MTILLNGEQTEYTGAAELSAFIQERFPQGGKIAVAINQEFVPRSSYDSVTLKEGDDLEIVAPMQGG
ncbi:thiamine biosynthesis protein ThiS [bacterium F16]|nr:thiamine biosynthesis protein ThiS [bacterium F16]